jgi:hypothetical protein
MGWFCQNHAFALKGRKNEGGFSPSNDRNVTERIGLFILDDIVVDDGK